MNVRSVLPRDAIPSVDDPRFRAAYDGDPDDEVIALAVGDEARAYPVRYLNYHEIVNDVFETTDGPGIDEGGPTPVAVTWCPLCGSAVVYDRRVEGRTLTFGVSGKLADDDLVMYDRETESEWKQSLGRAIAGELEGTELSVRPATVTTWASFREAHPDGRVLAPPGGESEAASDTDDPAPVEYDDGPYRAYFEGDGFGLDAHRGSGGREWDRGDDLDPKDVVIGLTAADVEADTEWRVDPDEAGPPALGFPLSRVEATGGVAHATVGRTQAVVFATPDGIHAFENRGFEFVPTGDGYFAADGLPWNGATGEAPDGRRLRRLPARRLFAFAWQDDHGPDAFWSPDG